MESHDDDLVIVVGGHGSMLPTEELADVTDAPITGPGGRDRRLDTVLPWAGDGDAAAPGIRVRARR